MGKTTISDQIRRAIETSGLSRYEICRRAGVDQATMSRFMARKRGVNTTTLDRLAEVLNLVLKKRKE